MQTERGLLQKQLERLESVVEIEAHGARYCLKVSRAYLNHMHNRRLEQLVRHERRVQLGHHLRLVYHLRLSRPLRLWLRVRRLAYHQQPWLLHFEPL